MLTAHTIYQRLVYLAHHYNHSQAEAYLEECLAHIVQIAQVRPPPPPDHSDANKQGCNCPRPENQNGNGTVEIDEDGYKFTEFTINPTCPMHSSPKAWHR